MHNCKSFKPSININSKVLILGSMPGIKSLEEQEYYAHPQNRFWKVMAHICNVQNLQYLDYPQKLEILLDNNIALPIKKFSNKIESFFHKVVNFKRKVV